MRRDNYFDLTKKRREKSRCEFFFRTQRGSFPFVPPSLVGAYYLQPPDARAIFSHNDLLCNGTCSVTGGSITYWGGGGGGTNGKDPPKDSQQTSSQHRLRKSTRPKTQNSKANVE